MQTVQLFAAFHRAKLVDTKGSRADGLGLAPLRNLWLLFVLVAVTLAYGGLFWLVRVAAPLPKWSSGALSIEAAYAGGGLAMRIAVILALVLLAPAAEEFFFRGWLWTGLRRFWRPLPVAVMTGLPWLLLHVVDDRTASLRLVPQAVLFGLARHYCGSVRASIALHVMNNMAAAAIFVWLYGI